MLSHLSFSAFGFKRVESGARKGVKETGLFGIIPMPLCCLGRTVRDGINWAAGKEMMRTLRSFAGSLSLFSSLSFSLASSRTLWTHIWIRCSVSHQLPLGFFSFSPKAYSSSILIFAGNPVISLSHRSVVGRLLAVGYASTCVQVSWFPHYVRNWTGGCGLRLA